MKTQRISSSSEAAFGLVGDVFNLAGAVGEYKKSQEQGDSTAVSLMKGAGNFAWGEFYYGGVARLANDLNITKAGGMIGSKIGAGLGTFTGAPTDALLSLVSGNGILGTRNMPVHKLLGGAGRIAGSFLGSMVPVMAMTTLPQLAAQAPLFWANTGDVMGRAYRQRGKIGSGYFAMTQAGYTMRQRSLNAIRQNGLNTQSVLGNEARTYFRASSLDD